MVTLTRPPGSTFHEAFPAADARTRFCYWAPQVAPGPVSLEDAWSAGGVFLVAEGQETPADIQSFLESVWRLWGGQGLKLIAWKKGMQSPPPYLRFKADSAFADGSWGSGLLLHTIGSSASDETELILRPAQRPVFSVQATASGFRFTSADQSQPPFDVLMGGFRIKLNWDSSGGMPSLLQLVVTDQSDASGSWRFEVNQASSRKFLEAAPPLIKYIESGKRAQVFPCFDLKASDAALGSTSIEAFVHPYVLDDTHTRFEFKSRVDLMAQFLDAAGRQLKLGTTNDAIFRLLANPKNSGPRAHMSPAGTFDVAFQKTTRAVANGVGVDAMEVLTGMAGTDFVLFGDGTSDLPTKIKFISGSPAFLPAGQTQLTHNALTAWVLPTSAKADPFQYAGQPEEAPLFALKTVRGGINAFTGLRDAPGMQFDPAPTSVQANGDKSAMPWLPVRNLTSGELGAARRLEKQTLAQTRRSIAADARAQSLLSTNDGPQNWRWVVMPQGFSVALDQENRWMQVAFAVSTGDIEATLVLERPKEVLRWPVEESLSRASTFLVASRFPDNMPVHGGSSPESPMKVQLSVARWKVAVDVGQTGADISQAAVGAPILVVKLGGGKSLVDQMSTPADWSLAEVLNADTATAVRELKASVARLKRLADGFTPLVEGELKITQQARDAYQRLHEKLTDPAWNGVIVFNAVTNANDLPDDLAALGAGLPPNAEFFVPCLGVDLAKVNESAGSSGSATPSQVPSVFVGIHHFDPDDLETKPNDFGLKLKNLDVVVDHSTLQLFVAKAQLRVSAMLGAEASDTGAGGEKNRLVRIEGSYQGRSAEGKDQYLIRALGEQVITMASQEVIERIRLTRLELASRKTGTTVFGKIGIWGEITFGRSIEEVSGAKAVSFDNLSITMTKEGDTDASFNFDAGHITVDWQKPSSGAGWLKNFPIKLSGLRWGGGDFSVPEVDWPKVPHLELPDVGFTNFDLSGLMPSLETGGGFDFGLEFDLDMGSFGALTDASKLLRSKVLVGWYDFRRLLQGGIPPFSLGFKFEGGSGPLDIGIQGILRLRAKKVILKQYANRNLLGIGLEEPQLDAFGYQIPEDPAGLLMAAVVEMGSGSLNNSPTWVVALTEESNAGSVSLDYLALGQNALLVDPGQIAKITSVSDAVTKSKDWLEEKYKSERLDELRPDLPTGKWNLVASGKIKQDIAAFKLAFLDDIPLYGLRVEAPLKAPWFALDILYKKLEDDLGVFAIEVDMKGLRTIELVAGSLTLPVFAFEKYSIGDWRYNFGFRGNDLSQAGTLQLLPFLGSASLSLGLLSGRSSQFLAAGATGELLQRYRQLQLKPVYELQVAFRIGIGKEIREGIFSAGASLTVYGIFQGALARINGTSATGSQYIKVAGAAGILLEVFGEVNFAVVSAAVYIRAWIETGIVAETWEQIAIYAEAGVSVHVRFVVARFRIFGRTIEIAIHFSFAMKLRIGTTLPYRIGGDKPPDVLTLGDLPVMPPEPWPDPLSWVPESVVARKLSIPLAVSIDAHLDDAGHPVLSPVLAFVNPNPQGLPATFGDSVRDLVIAGLRWAVRLSLGMSGLDPADIDQKKLRHLLRQMRSPDGLSASRWRVQLPDRTMSKPLEEGPIREFLKLNTVFTLRLPETAKQELLARLSLLSDRELQSDNRLHGIPMPWLKEIRVSANPGTRLIRDYADPAYMTFNEDWEEKVRAALAEARPDLDALDSSQSGQIVVGPLASQRTSTMRALVDIFLEDWFVAVVEGAVHRALRILESEKKDWMSFADLIAAMEAVPPGGVASPAVEVAQQASAVLCHAQRVPDALNRWSSLSAMAGLDIRWDPAGIHAADTSLVADPTGADWIVDPVELPFDNINGAMAEAALRQAAAKVAATGADLRVTENVVKRLRTVTFTRGLAFVGRDAATRIGTMFEVPGALQQEQLKWRTPGVPPSGSVALRFEGFGSSEETENLDEESRRNAHVDLALVAGMFLGGTFRFKVRRLFHQAPSSISVLGTGAAQPSAIRGVYGLSGGGESARLVLQSWSDKLADIAPAQFAILWNPTTEYVANPDEPRTLLRLTDQGVRFFATNLSTEANPDLRAAANGESMIAEITKPADVRAFLWKATLVNSDGFYIHIDESVNTQLVAEIEAQLDKKESVDVPLAWRRLAFPNAAKEGRIHPYETFLFADTTQLPQQPTAVVALPDRPELANGVPPGFAKLVVRRPNPLHGGVETAAAEFLSRYAFLEWGIKGGASPDLVFLDANQSSALAVDPPPNEATEILSTQEPEAFSHTVLLPLLQFASANRKPDGSLKEPGDRNPYAAVGANLQSVMGFSLRDETGHRFPFDVREEYPEQIIQRYTDPLQRIDSYPGVSLRWRGVRSGPNCEFEVTLAWSMPVDALRKLSADTRAQYVQMFSRLRWIVQSPGAVAAARVRVGGTSLALSTQPPDVASALAGFAHDVAEQLKAKTPPAKPDPVVVSLTLGLGVAPAEVQRALSAGADVQLIRVEIVLSREESLCDTELLKEDPLLQTSVSSALPAVGDGSPGDWTALANNLELALTVSNSPVGIMLKLQESTIDQSCWLARPEILREPVAAKREIVSFSPRPLAMQFRSGEAQLLDPEGLPPKTPLPKSVSEVDMDDMSRRSFDLLEAMLAPAVASRMCVASPTSLDRLVSAKSRIGTWFSEQLRPVEASHVGVKPDDAIKKKLRDLASADLRNVYRIGAVCDVRRVGASGPSPVSRIFGELEVMQPRTDAFKFSKFRIPTNNALSAPLVVFWTGTRRVASVEGKALRFSPQYIEMKWPGGFGDYIPSRWFEILSTGATDAIDIPLPAEVAIPLPLRELPKPPHLYGHDATASVGQPTSLRQARAWNYRLHSAVPGEEQDRVKFAVRYHAPSGQRALGAPARGLFDALVTLQHYSASLMTTISEVAKWDMTGPANEVRLQCERMARFVEDLADAFVSYVRIETLDALDEQLVDSFVSYMTRSDARSGHSRDGRAEKDSLQFDCIAAAVGDPQRRAFIELTDVTRVQQSGLPADVLPMTQTPIVGPAPGSAGRYEYYDQAQAVQGMASLSGRRLTLSALDIFQQATAVPEVSASRNERLGSVAVSSEFVFATSVSTSTRLVPRLRVRNRIQQSDRRTLKDHFRAIARELLKGSTQPLSLDAVATLRVPFRQEAADTFSYPIGAMKGISALPNEWEDVFEMWSGRVQSEVLAKSQNATPAGIGIAISVYADGYAGSLPVFIVDEIWLPWSSLIASAPALGFAPPRVSRPQELAAVLYCATKDLAPVEGGRHELVIQVREKMAELIRAGVPTLNALRTGPLPSLNDLRDEFLEKAWRDCVEIAHNSAVFAAPKGQKAAFWSVEPVNVYGERNLAASLSSGAEALTGRAPQLQVSKESETVTMLSSSDPNLFAGAVALYVVYEPARKW